MDTMDIEDAKRKIDFITSGIEKADWEVVRTGLYDIVININKSHQELADTTPRNHDIAALIQEMRHGFESMDKRFEAMDKRFDDLIHQMDKRFESMDKRFESMDKRFDDLIHYMDKRFEQVDKRFNTVFWMMGIGFTFFSFIITYGTFFKN